MTEEEAMDLAVLASSSAEDDETEDDETEEAFDYSAAYARPLLASALTDSVVRERWSGLRYAARSEDDTAAAEDAAAVVASPRWERLREAAFATAWEVAQSAAVSQESGVAAAGVGEAASSPLAATLESLSGAARDLAQALASGVARTLQTGRQLLTLPCLAPAMAAHAPERDLRRQSIVTGEGVRIEFQQLPGAPGSRLRVLVDAHGLHRDPAGAGGAAEEPYDFAYLTLEESLVATAARTSPPDRHVLVVPLNAAGRGFVDLTVGGGEAPLPGTLAAPRAPIALVSATLTRANL